MDDETGRRTEEDDELLAVPYGAYLGEEIFDFFFLSDRLRVVMPQGGAVS